MFMARALENAILATFTTIPDYATQSGTVFSKIW